MVSILPFVTNEIKGISSKLGWDQSAVDIATQVKDYITQRAKRIAEREFMYKLLGDNDIIRLEGVASLRGQGAIELAKSA